MWDEIIFHKICGREQRNNRSSFWVSWYCFSSFRTWTFVHLYVYMVEEICVALMCLSAIYEIKKRTLNCEHWTRQTANERSFISYPYAYNRTLVVCLFIYFYPCVCMSIYCIFISRTWQAKKEISGSYPYSNAFSWRHDYTLATNGSGDKADNNFHIVMLTFLIFCLSQGDPLPVPLFLNLALCLEFIVSNLFSI